MKLKIRTAESNRRTTALSPGQAGKAEDAKVKRMLLEARERPPQASATYEERAGAASFMKAMQEGSERVVLQLVQRKGLLTEDELAQKVGSRQWVSYAKKTGRLFSVVAHDGADFYPAFFACSLADRRALGAVSKALGPIPGRSKFHFFTSSSIMLSMTPLEALAGGRMKLVMRAAAGFAIR